MNPLADHFEQPQGLLGALAGWWMARQNRRLARWTLDRLGVEAGERILEVGSGPGTGLGQALRRGAGRVVGIDPSPVMQRQAAARNAKALDAGRIAIVGAEVSALPFADGSFQAVYSVNTVQLWPRLHEDLRELLRVLIDGGRLAMTLQARDAPDAGTVATRRAQLTEALTDAGFERPRVAMLEVAPAPAFCLVARKRPDGKLWAREPAHRIPGLTGETRHGPP